ncbi:MAG TPA: PCRF domain-containing protein, partial [Candidatus Omnitrophota bacterium]|nr:PCRF domain-containing protein [Candidatus Omnitrophota bacterium]
MNQPTFWDDSAHSNKLMRELKILKSIVEPFEKFSRRLSDVRELTQISQEEPEFVRQIESELNAL